MEANVSFELRINGQKVWSTERQVTRVALQSGRGEIGSSGVSPQDGVFDLFIEEVQPGGPVRLDEIERERDEYIRSTREGTAVGLPSYAPAEDANKLTQGVPDRNAEPGGPDVGEMPDLVQNRPEVSPTGSVLDETGAVEAAEKPEEEEETAEEEDTTADSNLNLTVS